jgi:uncharacterized protein YycO
MTGISANILKRNRKVDSQTGRHLLLCVVGLVFIYGCDADNSERIDSFELQNGDLLFQDVDCGELCDAIETVTEGYDSYNFSHVGIIAKDEKDNILVIEAVSAGVKATDISSFLNRSVDENNMPKVVVGRLKESCRGLIPDALEHASDLKGRPYDRIFAIDNEAYYCSELIYEIFLEANDKKPVFELQPMTFKDPATDEVLSVWREYFDELRIPVPQGQPGINPGAISRSPLLNIIYAYGKPGKKQ